MNSSTINDAPDATAARFALIVLYFFSGGVALVYQVLWARWLSTVFGVSIFGVAVTTIAFMLGLGLGSLVAERRISSFANPLKLFGGIEIGVAVFALLLPPIQSSLDSGLAQLTSGGTLTLWLAAQVVAAILVLTLPTLAMGFAFPMVVAAASSLRVSLADIYGWNTVGAAVGAFVPLILLPGFGWTNSIVGNASAGALVGLGALLLSQHLESRQLLATAANTQARTTPRIGVLVAYGVVGFAALVLEIAWVRLYGMVLLRTEYVLAAILGVYLIGIGLGSLLARRPWAAKLVVVFPMLAATCALVSLWALPKIGAWGDQAEFATLDGALVSQSLVLMAVTIPVTLVLGAWLPLIVRRSGDSSHAAAMLYGVNCLGGALGAAAAAFIFVPLVGSAASIVIASLLLFVAGMVWVEKNLLWLAVVPLAAGGAWLWSLPEAGTLLPRTLSGTEQRWINEDAVAITHVVQQLDGQILLLSDLQRMDASTAPSAVTSQRNQVRLPLLLHPQANDVLLLGLGTGISASAALDFGELSITAVELAAGAISAADRFFSDANRGILANAEIVRDDARRYLKTTSQDFDVIIGDLFHPDLVGRSALLSIQQFERARDRLKSGGIFAQWLALNQFDVDSLEIVLRSFARAFPDHALFVDGFRLAMVGTNVQGFDWTAGLSAASQRWTASQLAAVSGGEGPWTWLGRYWGKIPKTNGPLQDEWWPQVEYRLPAARFGGAIDLKNVLDMMLQQRPSLQQVVGEFALPGAVQEDFERAYIATDLAVRSWSARVGGNQGEAIRLLRLAYEANPHDQWISFQLADDMLLSLLAGDEPPGGRLAALQAVLKVAPDHPDALEQIWRELERQGQAVAADETKRRLQAVDPFRKFGPLLERVNH